MFDLERRKAVRKKLEEHADFGPLCAHSFYHDLFAEFPNLESLFPKEKSKEQMFGAMLSIITKTITDEGKLDDILADLGRRHGRLGITSLHMKVGRGIFVDAVKNACPKLEEEELGYFGEMYDKIATAMFAVKPRPSA